MTADAAGETLDVYVGDAALSPVQAVDLLIPACATLADAHAAGGAHGALDPSQLIVVVDDRGRAVDTKVRHDGEGAPSYVAPEQLGAVPRVDARTDVYTLGVILYELLSARLPYDTSDLRAVEGAIAEGAIMPLEVRRGDLEDGLYEAVATALATDPAERFADVVAFAQAIEPFGTRRFHAPGVRGPQAGWEETVVPEDAVSVRAEAMEAGAVVDAPARPDAWMSRHWPVAAGGFAFVVSAIVWTLATEPSDAGPPAAAVSAVPDTPAPPPPEVASADAGGVIDAAAGEVAAPVPDETPTKRKVLRKWRKKRASKAPTWTPLEEREASGTAREAPALEPLKVRTRDGRVRPSEF